MSADYKLETATLAVAKAQKAWKAAVAAWSMDPASDVIVTMKAGETMMYAATDLISAQEDLAEALADQAREAKSAWYCRVCG